MQAYLLDKQFFAKEILDEYDSFLWTDRYYECGEFEYYTGATQDKINAWTIGRYLRTSFSDRIMIIENRYIETDNEDGAKLKIVGQSGEAILKRRVIIEKVTYDKNTNVQYITKNFINPL